MARGMMSVSAPNESDLNRFERACPLRRRSLRMTSSLLCADANELRSMITLIFEGGRPPLDFNNTNVGLLLTLGYFCLRLDPTTEAWRGGKPSSCDPRSWRPIRAVMKISCDASSVETRISDSV